MKSRRLAVACVLLAFTGMVMIAAPASPCADRSAGGNSLALRDVVTSEKEDPEEPAPHRGAGWLAAAKIVVGNVGLWVIDRYIFNYDYSHIGWTTIKNNFRDGFIWDQDTLSTSFLGHPFHGGGYFNGARSLGLTFWECIPFNAVGYLTWGFIFENDHASYNDLIMTTLGGVNTGEMQFRISSQVLDDTASGGERVGRELLAFLINPARGINRLLSGAMFHTKAENNQLRETLTGNITLGGMLISDAGNLSQTHFGPGLIVDMAYGMDSAGIFSGHPFDIIFLNGEVRYAQKAARLQFSTYGPWFGKTWGQAGETQNFLGLFQHYDFLDNEALHMGGTSTTLGLVSLFPLGRGTTIRTSLQVGGLLLGGVKNDFVLAGSRTYNYGSGGVGKAEVWLIHPTLGTLELRLSHYRFFTIGGTAPLEADESRDVLTLFNAEYSLAISHGWGISLDYGRYARRQSFDGHPDTRGDESRVGAALECHF